MYVKDRKVEKGRKDVLRCLKLKTKRYLIKFFIFTAFMLLWLC